MYIQTTTDLIDANEPQLGSITESELMCDDGEALEVLYNIMEENQECPTTFYAIDDYTEEDIELRTSDYLTNEEIDMFNEMFMECDNWEYQHLKYMKER